LLNDHLEEMPGWPGKGGGLNNLADYTARRLMACNGAAWDENKRNAQKGGGR